MPEHQASFETQVLSELSEVKEQIELQNGRVERLERWTLMPADDIEGVTIKTIVRDANREALAEIFTWKNLIKYGSIIGGALVFVLEIVNAALKVVD